MIYGKPIVRQGHLLSIILLLVPGALASVVFQGSCIWLFWFCTLLLTGPKTKYFAVLNLFTCKQLLQADHLSKTAMKQFQARVV